jgi:hypothetical protein
MPACPPKQVSCVAAECGEEKAASKRLIGLWFSGHFIEELERKTPGRAGRFEADAGA